MGGVGPARTGAATHRVFVYERSFGGLERNPAEVELFGVRLEREALQSSG